MKYTVDISNTKLASTFFRFQESCRRFVIAFSAIFFLSQVSLFSSAQDQQEMSLSNGSFTAIERQVTNSSYGHLLTNFGAWTADSLWIVYDVRSDPAGSLFDGQRIERVHAVTGETEVLFTSSSDACCGVATTSPVDDRVVFIHGPENPSANWTYAACHRRGVIVQTSKPTVGLNLDARDLVTPFTPGALRGGTHVHTFSGDGQWIAFTYEDHLLTSLGEDDGTYDRNQRNVGVSVPVGPVVVNKDHTRNHNGSHFSVLVTKTVNNPQSGSDEISRAYQDGWVGTNGYTKSDGIHQQRAIAFHGQVVAKNGQLVSEVFVVDLPEDLTVPGNGPLEGTATTRPAPPKGVVQRRLTFTTENEHPGIQGPRHWLRSSPDGSQIAFLMKDKAGIVQFWTVSPNRGEPKQLTRNSQDVASAFTWSPDGRWLAYIMDKSVCVTNTLSGETNRLTPSSETVHSPRPEACVFSPNGKHLAYVRPVEAQGKTTNQIFLLTLEENN